MTEDFFGIEKCRETLHYVVVLPLKSLRVDISPPAGIGLDLYQQFHLYLPYELGITEGFSEKSDEHPMVGRK